MNLIDGVRETGEQGDIRPGVRSGHCDGKIFEITILDAISLGKRVHTIPI
jgi:hypothetical protein